MSTRRTAFLMLASMLVFSVFIANVANILNHDVDYHPQEAVQKFSEVHIDGSYDHLIWFLQISDIHISIFRDPSRIVEFKEFCHQTVDIIKPTLVLASGDLTDAKTSDNIGSKQFRKEWEHYNNILHETNVLEKTQWLDIRGNHDNFNVASLKSKENYFTNYSVQGHKHSRSYLKQFNHNGDKYSFIGIDACLEPGPRRPFNFVGMIDDTEITQLNEIVAKVKESDSSYTVWFGHFPTSCILSTGTESVREIIRHLDQSLVYVCGHLHTLGGIVPKMYTLQKDGFLELELGDWKDNRRFRLLAIDHGMLSFTDEQHNEFPIILVTNPKHALFMIPNKDNPNNIKNSSHIRVLAFSSAAIESVKVSIDNNEWRTARNVKGPLFVLEWETESLSTGLHNIQVHVADVEGRQRTITQPFSMDGTRLAFDLLSRIALMTNASVIFKVMFGMLLLSTVFPLVLFRLLHKLVKAQKLSKPTLRRNCITRMIKKFWILSTVDRLFWPLVLYPIYLCIGPWSIGHIIEDHIGVIFAWGIFINGTYLPGSFTYAYGFLQLLTFQIPITCILANGVYYRFQQHLLKPGKPGTKLSYIFLQLPFIILLTVQIIMAYFFWLAYGTLAFLLGPLRTWSVILAVVLWRLALHLPEKCTRDAAAVWYVEPNAGVSQTDMSLNNVRN